MIVIYPKIIFCPSRQLFVILNMATAKKHKVKRHTAKKHTPKKHTTKRRTVKRASGTNNTYLTKRRLASAARKSIRIAAINTMDVMGYTVVAHKGWVVKKYADGTIEKITPLATAKESSNISLD